MAVDVLRKDNKQIHHPLGTDYREENVMNLKSVPRWQLMFSEKRTNIHSDKRKGQLNKMLDKTV